MAKRVYVAEFDAKDARYNQKLDKMQSKTLGASKKMEGAFKKLGAALIAAFSAQQVLNFMRTSIELYGRQEQAVKKLNTALGKTTTGLQKYASELQKVTTYGDENIIEAMALIGAFVKEEDQIKLLTKATLDLAAAKGMDLVAAADLVAKSVGSSTNALSRYGIEITGAVGSTERLETAVINITKRFGGQAEAEANTMYGAIQQVRNQIGDLQEEIGRKAIPIQLSWNKVLLKGLEAFNLLQKGLRQYLISIGAVTPEKMPLWSPRKNKMPLWSPRDITDLTPTTTPGGDKPTVEQLTAFSAVLDKAIQYRQVAGGADIFGFMPGNSRTGAGGYNADAGAALSKNLDDANYSMLSIASLGNQVQNTLGIAGHTFAADLIGAASTLESIASIIATIGSFITGGGGIFGFLGLEKGGRVTNLGSISHTKIPSFAGGGSYSTPSYAGPISGGYPVMVHRG